MRESGDPSTAAAEVYAVMRRRILRGDLVIGAPISRRRVAADFSTSLRPAVEALIRLECDGFLEHRPRSGTRVRVPSADEVRGHFVVHEALEVQAAERFTEMASPRARQELMALAVRVDALAVRADRPVYARAHQKLHLQMAEGGGCRALYDAIEKSWALASLWRDVMHPRRAFDGSASHQELVAGVVSGDPSAAAAAVRRHSAAGMQRSLEALEPYFRTERARRETFRRSRRDPVAHRADPLHLGLHHVAVP